MKNILLSSILLLSSCTLLPAKEFGPNSPDTTLFETFSPLIKTIIKCKSESDNKSSRQAEDSKKECNLALKNVIWH